jgi:cyclase
MRANNIGCLDSRRKLRKQMTAKKIIPCLDMKDGKVVKGVNFTDLKDVGDPVECAKNYEKQGADEIVFLDISATNEKRKTMVNLVRKTAESISVPLVVGGGISSIEDFRSLLDAGATKLSINSAAVKRPALISQVTKEFGSDKVIVAIDGKLVEHKDGKPRYNVLINGGELDAGLDVVMWAKKVEKLGAGEILLTSLDADGTKNGYDLGMTKVVADAVNIPVTASGGVGSLDDFVEVFKKTSVSAALGASVFHFGDLTVDQVKARLKEEGIPVNL